MPKWISFTLAFVLLFALLQLRFPLLPPVGAQATRHDHANQSDEPEPKANTHCLRWSR